MRRYITAALILAIMIFSHLGRSQSPPAIVFDAASVKVNKSQQPESLSVNPNGIVYQAVTLHRCIETAFEVMPYQVRGPEWIHSDKYDISARTDSRADYHQLMQMLRELLRDRFKLVLHREAAEMPVYALNVRNTTSKLRPAELQALPSVSPTSQGFSFRKMAMTDFAAGFLGTSPAVDRPVLDKTALDGRFDFDLPLAPDYMRRSLINGGDPLGLVMDALSVLGLKLESQKAHIDTLVIDYAEKVPTEN